jgi:CspA family cold shock protein
MISSLQNFEGPLRENKNIIKAKLKWFNAAKGFGFVVPEEDPVDAFLHITQLQKLGLHGLGEGAEVLCVVDRREKGAIVVELVKVISLGAVPTNEPEIDANGTGLYKIKGIVKLYFEEKGFGFVTPDDGMKDVFIHKSCLDNCGVSELHPGQRVRISFKIADKGREAVQIEIEGNP